MDVAGGCRTMIKWMRSEMVVAIEDGAPPPEVLSGGAEDQRWLSLLIIG
jgi:hypothetical protein